MVHKYVQLKLLFLIIKFLICIPIKCIRDATNINRQKLWLQTISGFDSIWYPRENNSINKRTRSHSRKERIFYCFHDTSRNLVNCLFLLHYVGGIKLCFSLLRSWNNITKGMDEVLSKFRRKRYLINRKNQKIFKKQDTF